MRRRLVTILSALSLMLCVTICAEWVRSYRRVDTVGWSESTLTSVWQIEVMFSRGGLFFQKSTITNSTSLDPFDHPYRGMFWEASDSHPLMRKEFPEKMAQWDYSFHFLGIWWATLHFSIAGSHEDEVPFTETVSMVYVPTWWIAALLAAAPVVWCVRFSRRSRRRATGRCLNCGYDLRATLHQCPECGTIPVLLVPTLED